jgi:hypothetical protein
VPLHNDVDAEMVLQGQRVAHRPRRLGTQGPNTARTDKRTGRVPVGTNLFVAALCSPRHTSRKGRSGFSNPKKEGAT